jgi:hypothetical protein
LLSLITLFFELLFPFLVWVPPLRLALLGLAFAFHAAMACLLSIGSFPAIMFAALLSFLEECDLRCFQRSLASFRVLKNAAATFSRRAQPSAITPAGEMPITSPRRSRPVHSAAMHLAAAGAVISCGLFVQMRYDWYGVFGRYPAPTLNEVVADEVSEMLAQRPAAYEDYFHRIELGSRFGGNQVFGTSHKFKIGQRAYILAQLIQPHPVLELEGLLISPDGAEVARFTHRVDAGTSYAINGFELAAELPSGRYRIILQADGFVIAERQFELQR